MRGQIQKFSLLIDKIVEIIDHFQEKKRSIHCLMENKYVVYLNSEVLLIKIVVI